MSIDAFLQELFPSAPPPPATREQYPEVFRRFDMNPDAREQWMEPHEDPANIKYGNFLKLAGGGAPPANFDERFAPAMAQPLQDAGLPPDAQPMAGEMPPGGMIPGQGVPMPRPRPPIEALLAGPRPRPDEAGPGASDLNLERPPRINPMPAPGGGGGGPMAIFQRLAGMLGGGGAAPQPPAAEEKPGILDKLTGKRAQTMLAGGFAGGNPAFKGGAFMKGASGSLTGGLKSDKEDTEAETAAEDKEQKQKNFDRTQTDKEKTSAALAKLYGVRGDALTTNAAAATARAGRAPATGKTPWNKPAHERLKDAERLIIDKEKQLRGAANPLAMSKDERTAANGQIKQEMDAFRKRIYKNYGFDESGAEVPDAAPSGGTPSSSRVIGDKEAKDTGLYPKGTFDDPAKPESKEEFDALPAGTIFINPADGRPMTKRG